MKFKIGDKVKRINGHNAGVCEGDIGHITSIETRSSGIMALLDIGVQGEWHDVDNLEFISNNKKQSNNMNILERFKNLTVAEPRKSLIKYGIVDNTGELTEDGFELAVQWLFEKNIESFVKDVIDPLKKEDAKKKDKED